MTRAATTRAATTGKATEHQSGPRYAVGELWRRGDSVRVIQELNHAGDPNTQVIYALYRRQRIWNQHTGQTRDQWWLKRQGYCRLSTFERWLHHAHRFEPPTEPPRHAKDQP
jgi:hypothetical protein